MLLLLSGQTPYQKLFDDLHINIRCQTFLDQPAGNIFMNQVIIRMCPYHFIFDHHKAAFSAFSYLTVLTNKRVSKALLSRAF